MKVIEKGSTVTCINGVKKERLLNFCGSRIDEVE